MFQHRGNHVLKVATIKGKNMLPIGSIFFPLKVAPMEHILSFKVAPMRIDDNFNGNLIVKPPKLKDTNMSVF